MILVRIQVFQVSILLYLQLVRKKTTTYEYLIVRMWGTKVAVWPKVAVLVKIAVRPKVAVPAQCRRAMLC